MKKKRFSEEQIIRVLKESEKGAKTLGARRLGVRKGCAARVHTSRQVGR